MRKIGIYGGTFDPIHHAHLILAREARELIQLEKVIFVPAAVSPGKDSPVAPAEMRLSMLRAAIESETGFAIDDCELRRPPPSYTVDTVEEVRKREGQAEIYCFIGEDNVAALPTWHRFTDLGKLVRFVVLDRTGSAPAKHSYEVVRRNIDISATDIRNRVASGRSIRYLVPPSVEEIIRRHNLYREPAK
ncbi:MAG TPA: nicotinate-nucleotide adenylyltransferase [Chthoniobacterales bacterium]|nr:nicotinate-nucleotide adenylyltransferase [Chthoniobacterales bacterium]